MTSARRADANAPTSPPNHPDTDARTTGRRHRTDRPGPVGPPPWPVESARKGSRAPLVRRLVVAVALVGVLAGCLSPTQQSALDALNGDRNANGLVSLPTQDDVQAKAQQWADRLAGEGALYHSNLPDGIATRWCSLGENVGYGTSVSAIEAGFMGSSGHRANILSGGFNGVGVGVARNGNTVWVVQEFITTC